MVQLIFFLILAPSTKNGKKTSRSNNNSQRYHHLIRSRTLSSPTATNRADQLVKKHAQTTQNSQSE
uniref:Secreted protein n=1 Tax=Arundo donax TaxID=35708 RepID=A0A0A9FZY0_ARUDO